MLWSGNGIPSPPCCWTSMFYALPCQIRTGDALLRFSEQGCSVDSCAVHGQDGELFSRQPLYSDGKHGSSVTTATH